MRRPSHGTVVAYLALFVALGGVSYAAITLPRNSVGNAQLKRNAVTSDKIRDGTLRRRDFAARQLLAGAAGVKGDTGAPGAQGPQGPQGPAGADGSPGAAADASDLKGMVSGFERQAEDPAENFIPILTVPGYGTLFGDCDTMSEYQTDWVGETGATFASVDTGEADSFLSFGAPVSSTESNDRQVWVVANDEVGMVLTVNIHGVNGPIGNACNWHATASYIPRTP